MGRREQHGVLVKAAAACFYPLSWLGRREYRGSEHIPQTGPALLVMNHVSHLDPPNDAIFVYRNNRIPRILAKDSIFRLPVFGRMLRDAGGIPVYRGSGAAKESLAAASDALREGKLVLIYPEGSITKDPTGWPMRARTGIARLALDNDVPVLPAARWGTQRIYNGYTKKFRPFPRKTVVTSVGAPVQLSAYRGQPVTNTLLREVTEVIMAEVTTLLADIRGEQAPAEPYRPAQPGSASDSSAGDSASGDSTSDGAGAGEGTGA